MNRAVTLMLTLTVIGHSLVGCCAHHAHAADGEAVASCCQTHRCGHGVLDAQNLDGHRLDREHAGATGTPEFPAEPCSEGSCVFVRSDAFPSMERDVALAFCDAVVVGEWGPSQQWAVVAKTDSHRASPPTRLHLLHQILLI